MKIIHRETAGGIVRLEVTKGRMKENKEYPQGSVEWFVLLKEGGKQHGEIRGMSTGGCEWGRPFEKEGKEGLEEYEECPQGIYRGYV